VSLSQALVPVVQHQNLLSGIVEECHQEVIPVEIGPHIHEKGTGNKPFIYLKVLLPMIVHAIQNLDKIARATPQR
jgi:hypothetical protein